MSIRDSKPGEFSPIGHVPILTEEEYAVYQNGVDTVKASNPKDSIGVKKVSIMKLPLQVVMEVSLAMLEGSCKYGAHNYRKAGVRTTVYIDAAVGRHLIPFVEGQDIDPASGIHHVTKAIAGLMVLRDAMLNDKCYDDRPIKANNQNWLEDLNKQAVAILDKYPNPKKPFTQVGQDEGTKEVPL